MSKVLSEATRKKLTHDLVKLGDMLGDGDCEPEIAKHYKNILTALGYIKPPARRKRNITGINAAVSRALLTTMCPSCNGELTQSRSGSYRVICKPCNKKYQFK